MKITPYSPILLVFTILLAACQDKKLSLATLAPAPTPNLTVPAEQEQFYLSSYENGAFYGGVAAWGDQVYFFSIADPTAPRELAQFELNHQGMP